MTAIRLYDPCALCVSESIFIETEEIGQNAKKTRSDRQQLPELDIARKTAHDISSNQSVSQMERLNEVRDLSGTV